jgi:hypothetical protein
MQTLTNDGSTRNNDRLDIPQSEFSQAQDSLKSPTRSYQSAIPPTGGDMSDPYLQRLPPSQNVAIITYFNVGLGS